MRLIQSTSRRRIPSRCLLSAFLLLFAGAVQGADAPQAEIVSVKKIWDAAPHNAFTDLIWKDGRWFCVFREGQKHSLPTALCGF